MPDKSETQSRVTSDDNEKWVLDGGVRVSRRFDIGSVPRKTAKLLPRDVPAHPTDDRKPVQVNRKSL